MEWRPIESAPTEECTILAWDTFSVFECYWYGQQRRGETAGHSPRPHITHWQPMPTPPANQDET